MSTRENSGIDYQNFKKYNRMRSSDEEERKRQLALERRKGQFDMISWLLRQNDYVRYAETHKLRYKALAGEIYEIDFGINVNAELSYRHYGLVLADSEESNPLVMVCPLKTNFKGAHPASDVNLGYIEELNSDHESLAIINQIRMVDKIRIYRRTTIGKYVKPKYTLSDVEQDDFEDEYEGETYTPYRLEAKKFEIVKTAIMNYIKFGKIDPEEKNY
ncbi:MAG: type II toxin-antitoxin system PemK/MazF family toxin [Bacilli bacterium]|nr:type II toxin-antitoxin system PemK/MazF family toxin [Bacilli bacterium]